MNTGNHPKILLVDDSPNNLVALQAVFKEDAYELLMAHSGEEALSKVISQPDISLILLDVQMPGMDGFETAKRIKDIPGYRDVPIIFITAIYREDPFVKKGYESGGIDYFGKPFDPDILRMKVGVYVTHRQKEQLLKERERRLQQTEELLLAGRKLTTAFESQPLGVLITNGQGQICLSNEVASHILGDANSDKFGELLGPEFLSRAITEYGIKNERLLLSFPPEAPKSVNCSSFPLKDLNGDIFGSGIIIQDVTESKRIEQDMETKILSLMSMGLEFDQTKL